MNEHIHTCNYECQRPKCIKAQRDNLFKRFVEGHTEWATFTEDLWNRHFISRMQKPEIKEGEKLTPLYANPQPFILKKKVLITEDEMYEAAKWEQEGFFRGAQWAQELIKERNT